MASTRLLPSTGKPFGTESGRAWSLHLLELMALFVVWFINMGRPNAVYYIFLSYCIILIITNYKAGR